jgi:hypothetical protein
MDPVIADACRHLRANLVGILRFDDEALPIRFVVAPDGRLVVSAMVAMLRSGDVSLAIPDEGEESLELMLSLEEFSESGPLAGLADRWRIHHGEPPDVRWAVGGIDAGRFRGYFIDGEAFELSNPLAAEEAAICSEANASLRPQLRAAALAEARRRNRPPAEWGLDAPTLVGADPGGFDLRGAYGILRIESDAAMTGRESAIAELRRLAGE